MTAASLTFDPAMQAEGYAIITAGNAVTIKDGKVVSEVRPVVPTDVELRAGSTSVVYYQGSVPPIAFDWTSDSAKTASIYQITLASDKTYKDVIFSETVRKTGSMRSVWETTAARR